MAPQRPDEPAVLPYQTPAPPPPPHVTWHAGHRVLLALGLSVVFFFSTYAVVFSRKEWAIRIVSFPLGWLTL